MLRDSKSVEVVNMVIIVTQDTIMGIFLLCLTQAQHSCIFQTVMIMILNSLAIGVEFISRILRGKLYREYNGLFLVTCDTSKFDPVSIYMNSYWFEISPETYIVNVN